MQSYDNDWFSTLLISDNHEIKDQPYLIEGISDIDQNWDKVLIEINPRQYFTLYDKHTDSYWIGDIEDYLHLDFSDFVYWEPPYEWTHREIKWSNLLRNIDYNRLNGQRRDISWLKIPDFKNNWGLCRMSHKIPFSRL